jgi:hypothetical protein
MFACILAVFISVFFFFRPKTVATLMHNITLAEFGALLLEIGR